MIKKIQIKTEEENGIIVLAVLAMTCMIAKILQIYYLPAKYTYDGRRILSQALSGYRSGDLGYDTTENFFAVLIKWLHVEEYEQWAILLGFVGSVLALQYIKKYLRELYLTNAVFIMCSLMLLNIYVFNVSKEFLQMIMFFPAIYSLNRRNEKGQLGGMLLSLLLVGIFLRRYFFLIMIIFLVIYFLLRNMERLEGDKLAVFLIGLALTGVLGLTLLQRYLPEIYENITGARYFINQFRMESPDASTMIVDMIKNSSSPLVYIGNLGINFIRLCFPIELLSKGFMQVIFVIYQLILSVKAIKSFIQCIKGKFLEGEKNRTIAISFLFAYLIVSAVFEPDFGSFTRHEIVFFPIFCVGMMRGYEGAKSMVGESEMA